MMPPIKMLMWLFWATGMPGLASASDLNRAALLGIAAEPSGYQQGVKITRLAADSTASGLGMQVGDQLLELNGQVLSSFNQVLAIMAEAVAGETINVVILRGDEEKRLSGRLLPKPYETSEVATVTYEQVDYEGNSLRSIVHTPKGFARDEQLPAIFYLQGYTCDSIDYAGLTSSSVSRLVAQFVSAGFIVYRVEKPGVGDSRSRRDCREINFTEESTAFRHGLRTLKARSQVDSRRIYLWGHSLGVLHSAVLARSESVAGVIGYGGVYKRWYDYLLDVYQLQSVKHYGASQRAAARNVGLVQPFLDLWLNTDRPFSDVVSADTTQPAINAGSVPVSGDQVFDRHFSFFRTMNQYDFTSAWRELEVPVLMIHGSLDIQAIDEKWAFDIAEANNLAASRALVIDGAEHALLRYGSQRDYRTARYRGEFNPGNAGDRFDSRIGKATIDWITSLTTRREDSNGTNDK